MLVTHAVSPTFVVGNLLGEEHTAAAEFLEELMDETVEFRCEFAILAGGDESSWLDVRFAVSGDLRRCQLPYLNAQRGTQIDPSLRF